MRAEFEEQQKKNPLAGGLTVGNSIQDFDMASWMAGKPGKTEKTEKIEKTRGSTGKETGGGSTRRRG